MQFLKRFTVESEGMEATSYDSTIPSSASSSGSAVIASRRDAVDSTIAHAPTQDPLARNPRSMTDGVKQDARASVGNMSSIDSTKLSRASSETRTPELLRNSAEESPHAAQRATGVGTERRASSNALAAETEALAAAETLRAAAAVADALAPRLLQALRRAEEAEAEVARLRAALADSNVRIESMQGQQLRLTEGFIGEIRQRDAELALLRAAAVSNDAELAHLRAAAVSTPDSVVDDGVVTDSSRVASTSSGVGLPASSTNSGASASGSAANSNTIDPTEFVEVLTFTEAGPLGIELDRTNECLKIVAAVDARAAASGRLFVGDEMVSINGASARNLSWEEMDATLLMRPIVLSVRRIDTGGSPGAGPARGLANRVRNIAGWTRGAAAKLMEALDAEDDYLQSYPGDGVVRGDGDAIRPKAAAVDSVVDLNPEEPDDAEARNRPFYALVRASMADACSAEVVSPGAGDGSSFEKWLREFHSERDDVWYSSNHSRVYNAFRPHWDDVVAAHRALAAS